MAIGMLGTWPCNDRWTNKESHAWCAARYIGSITEDKSDRKTDITNDEQSTGGAALRQPGYSRRRRFHSAFSRLCRLKILLIPSMALCGLKIFVIPSMAPTPEAFQSPPVGYILLYTAIGDERLSRGTTGSFSVRTDRDTPHCRIATVPAEGRTTNFQAHFNTLAMASTIVGQLCNH